MAHVGDELALGDARALRGLFGSRQFFGDLPALVYLGEISYSTYMVHYIFLVAGEGLARKLFGTTVFPLWYWLCVVAAIYPASALSYHLVELPSRRLIRSLVGRKRAVQTR